MRNPLPKTHDWGLSLTHTDTKLPIHEIIPEDDNELQWELAHSLHEANPLIDADDFVAQFCAILHEKNWTHPADIGDAATIMRPYIRILEPLFEMEAVTYTDNVQARYFDQLAWMFLHTYAHIHIQRTHLPSNE